MTWTAARQIASTVNLYLRVPAWLKWFPRPLLLQVMTAGIWLVGQFQQAGRVTVVILAVLVGAASFPLCLWFGWIGLSPVIIVAGWFLWQCYRWGRKP